MAYLRLPTCSPYRVFWTWLRPVRGPADEIHRAYSRYVFWRGEWKVLAKLALLCVAYPFVFLASMWKYTRRLAPQVKAATGKGIARQMLEQFWVSFAHSISPRKYYVFELFRDERLAEANQVILRYEFKGGLHELLESTVMHERRSTRPLINDKALFAERCREFGVNAAPAFLIFDRHGARQEFDHKGPGLPKANLFVKPLRGKGGRGVERWDIQPDGSYLENDGRRLDAAALEAHLVARGRAGGQKGGIVVQPVLVNHPSFADISDRAFTTMRIMSMRRPDGGFEVTHAVFKMPLKKGAIVDNFHAGGLVCRVDVETGELGPASDSGSKVACRWFDRNPVTDAPITGRRMPLWAETKALVESAHAAFADRVIAGWDVGITADGPVIVEGNVQCGCDMIQRTHRQFVGRSRMAEYYVHHVRETESKLRQWGLNPVVARG